MKSLLEKLTIIIPTHNRPEALKRLLDYIKILNIKSKIIIVDSSKINKKINSYTYFHIPKKNANLKILKILKIIKTEYVITVADDDFFIPEALSKCLIFLNKNKKYIGVHGDYYTHSKLINLKHINFYKFIPINYPTEYIYSDKKKNLKRAIQYLDGKCPPLNYALFRSKVFKKVWKLATTPKQEKVIFLETIPSFLFYLYGNIKSLNFPYITRERSFRKKRQKEFTDIKSFNLGKKFLINILSKESLANKKQINLLNKCLNYKRNSERNKFKIKPKFDFFVFKFYKMILVLYYVIFENYKFKKELKSLIKKYPGVIKEIRNTEMK